MAQVLDREIGSIGVEPEYLDGYNRPSCKEALQYGYIRAYELDQDTKIGVLECVHDAYVAVFKIEQDGYTVANECVQDGNSSSDESSEISCSTSIPQVQTQYTVIRPIARGRNGQVSLGSFGGEFVAVKQALTANTTNTLAKEVQALQILRQHPEHSRYVGELLAVDVLPFPSAAIYRFYGKGNLETFLVTHPEISFSKRISLMVDVSSAMRFIHGADILHKDLKAENILIHDDGTIRITDFGCATQTNYQNVDFGGDFLTRSPKMLANFYTQSLRNHNGDPNPSKGLENFSKVDDVYSLALVLYHIVTGHLPFGQFKKSTNLGPLYNHVVVEKSRPDTAVIPKGNARLITLLSACWQEDEQARPDINSVDHTLKKISEAKEPRCTIL